MILGVSALAGTRRLPVSLLLLTIAILGVAAWCFVTRAGAPSDGTAISVGDTAISPDGVIIVAVHDPVGPVQPGDRVVSIDGVPMADRLAGRPGGAPVTLG